MLSKGERVVVGVAEERKGCVEADPVVDSERGDGGELAVSIEHCKRMRDAVEADRTLEVAIEHRNEVSRRICFDRL